MLLDAMKLAIDFVKRKERVNREFFDDYIEPLFSEFEKTATKYMKLFEADNVSEMKAIRGDYLQARIKVSELTRLYREEFPDELPTKFFEAMYGFFFSKERLSSFGEDYIDAVSRLNPETPERERLKESMVRKQRESWQEAVRCYGEMKLKYKRPISIKPNNRGGRS